MAALLVVGGLAVASLGGMARADRLPPWLRTTPSGAPWLRTTLSRAPWWFAAVGVVLVAAGAASLAIGHAVPAATAGILLPAALLGPGGATRPSLVEGVAIGGTVALLVVVAVIAHDGVRDSVLHTWRHGLASVGQPPVGDNLQDPIPGVLCVHRRFTEELEDDLVALVEEQLDRGAAAVVFPSWPHDFVSWSGHLGRIDPARPVSVLLASEPRFLVQSSAFDVLSHASDDEHGRYSVPPARSAGPVRLGPSPVAAIPRPAGAAAPFRWSLSNSSQLEFALVGVAPDGEFVPNLALAAWALQQGATGDLGVSATEVRVGDQLRVPAANGWLPVAYAQLSLEDAFDRLAPSCPDATTDIGPSDAAAATPWASSLVDSAGMIVVIDPYADGGITLAQLQRLATGERPRQSSTGLTALLALAATVTASTVGRHRGWWWTIGVTVWAAATIVWLADVTFDDGAVFDLVPVLTALVFAALFATGWRTVAERRRSRRLERLVTEYVPRELVGDLLPAAQGAPLEVGERDATVLFCDLRNFTPVAAELDPPVIQRLLEVFYRHVVDRVVTAGGTLVQSVGDEVFAIFGPPALVADHADRALACAQALRNDRGEFRRALADQGFPLIEYGIGVHAGRIITADVGGEAHRRYSVIGDAVNVGSRLTTAAGGGEVLLSDDVLARLTSSPAVEAVAEVHLKGVERPLAVFRLI